MQLFEVAVIQKANKQDREGGKQDELVYGPKAVMANDQQHAAIIVAMLANTEQKVDLGRMEIKARPF